MSLFPFLAVLICTMGALILLLVIIARQAQRQAAAAAEAEEADTRKQLEADLELASLMHSQLGEIHRKTEAQLGEARRLLGNVEDHIRQLEDRLAQLQAAARELAAAQAAGTQDHEALAAQLAATQAAVADTQRRLKEAQERARRRSSAYAVVPYQGPHQTRRIPMYIECRADAVILQPEGITLTDNDFAGPLGPGNPLEVALRARREYLQQHGQLATDGSEEPYPLFLVRPGGIAAYYAARAAVGSWADEFGYELIDEDWELAFPQPDPQLAPVLERAIGAARVRQQLLLAAAPGRYGRPIQKPRYRAAPYRGGAVLVPGTDPGPRTTRLAQTAGPSPADRPAASGDGDQPAATRFPPHDAPASPSEPLASQPLAGTAPSRTTPPSRPPATDLPPPTASRETQPAPRSPRGNSAPNTAPDQATPLRPLAERRGPNWGLPQASRGSVPITRPIAVACYADRLELLPEEGYAPAQTVPLEAETEEAIEAFVSAVWQRIETWGIAGHGMYWQPVLQLRVQPGGEQRYADIRTLLQGSGLEVTRQNDP